MEDHHNQQTFLGQGWRFPPVFSKEEGGVLLSSGTEDIRESLAILLATRLKERLMRPGYGCNLEELLFEPLDDSMITYIKDLIKTAILYFEPRIDPEEINISTQVEDQSMIEIEVQYVIRATNSRFNHVFPFYKNEGTHVEV